MLKFNRRNAVGAMAVAVACALLSGCYTQLQTDVVRVEPEREGARIQTGAKGLSVTTDSPWYETPLLSESVTIGARFENRGHAPVLLAGCPHPPSVVIEEWKADEWWDGIQIGVICYGTQSRQVLTFEPGDWLDFEFRLSEPGWYRIRLLVGPNVNNPTAVVHSNQFLIRQAEED